jgi:hypothetical protein
LKIGSIIFGLTLFYMNKIKDPYIVTVPVACSVGSRSEPFHRIRIWAWVKSGQIVLQRRPAPTVYGFGT